MRNKKLLWCSLAVIAVATLYFAGIASYPAKAQKRPRPETTTPQTLPFSQNWTNVGLITANDDWSGVPGITGYLGNFDVGAVTNVDPRTLLTPFATNDIDAIANQASVALTNGGVAEFDGIANPVVALQGSGTADAPSIVIYLNTTGNTGINFACNIRDIDDSVDNAAQQVDVQYRVGGTGNYTSVTGGYIADASSGPSTTMTTPLNLALPAAVDNQALVEIRVITTNAVGSDEWVGVDDISVTSTPVIVNTQHVVDFNGDGKTDWVTVRNTGGGPSGQASWFVQENTGAGAGAAYQFPWGISTDFFIPEDYDGDGKTDYAVWRAGAPGAAAWYILESIGSTVRAENYGQTGDDPTVVGDYNNDNKADLAVYRAGAAAGDPSFWFYRITANGPVFARQWGQNGDFPAPGDYDGDGSADFVVQRSVGFAGQGAFWMNYAAVAPGTLSRYVQFGTSTDVIVPGDYDGDGKTDLALTRGSAGSILWFIEPSTALGTFDTYNWGLSATDLRTQGDYDGDGKTDIAVWRPNADPTQNFFFVRKSTNGALFANEWGQNGDRPVANYNQH
jgi:hypothetical protein